ncbi:MAG TPA: efflux RND transporter periplasmic adaptor subunit [Vicinamibacterales bacterium]|nr:efflux RND transporter periplasmic adaptor subunit [Vicinamibacterales bacterium]
MRFLKNKKLIASVLLVAAIGAAAMWPEAMEVSVVRAERGPMQVTVDEDGETRVRDRFLVTAPVSGRVHRIEIEPGDMVVRGKTLLARITPAESPLLDSRTRGELQAAVDAATAAVGQARAERQRAATALERARSTLRRQQELNKAGAISTDDLEASQTALASAEDAVRAAEFTERRAESEVQLARARLSAPSASGRSVDVLSPVDGTVLKRLRESEGVVPVGEPLLEIGEPGRMEIVADLLSTDAVRVSPGAAVLIEQWGGGHTLHARVRRVEPSGFMKVSALGVEEQRVNVVIDFTNPAEAARLGDGYRVEVRIVLWQEDDVLKVPVGALFRQGDGWAVFVVEEGRVRRQTVQLGQRNENEGQITGGLEAGTTIVLHPPDTLTDGARVIVQENES